MLTLQFLISMIILANQGDFLYYHTDRNVSQPTIGALFFPLKHHSAWISVTTFSLCDFSHWGVIFTDFLQDLLYVKKLYFENQLLPSLAHWFRFHNQRSQPEVKPEVEMSDYISVVTFSFSTFPRLFLAVTQPSLISAQSCSAVKIASAAYVHSCIFQNWSLPPPHSNLLSWHFIWL